MENILGE
jgi:hypothetical protein